MYQRFQLQCLLNELVGIYWLKMGFLREKRHWSVPQILQWVTRPLSHKSLKRFNPQIQSMCLKWWLRLNIKISPWLRSEYQDCQDVILTIDGLQPSSRHETLYVVRELSSQHIWLEDKLLSSAHAEILKLILCTQQLAEQLNKPVLRWVYDK